MNNFTSIFIYIAVIAFLPLICVTVKSVSWNKLKNRVFLKAIVKDFIRTLPICGLVALPVCVFPSISKAYLYLLQTIFVPLMFIELGHIYLFGTRVGLNTFYAFFTTNVRETREFASQNIPLILFIGFPLVWLPPYFLIANFTTPSFNNINMQLIAIICALLLAIPFIRNLPLNWPKFKDGYVLNPYSSIFYHFWKYKKNYKMLREKIANYTAKPFKTISSELSENTKQTYIIVIGESANRMHFSAYGYERNTNEFTANHDVIWLNNVFSQYAQTMPSLEKTLTFADEKHPNWTFEKGSIIDYFKQAGFKTYWLSNQYALAEGDTIITAITSHSDWSKCYNFGGLKRFEKSGIDGDLLPDIEKFINTDEQKKVIFIHLIGSHAAYVNRYPSEFKYFTGKVKRKKLSANYQEFLNSYDDSIRYTDWVIAQILNLLKKQKGANYLLYFSDHGEDVFDSTTKKLLGHSEKANIPMTSVPLMLWLSPELEKLRPDIRKRISNKCKKYNLNELIHTIIDISSLKNSDYKMSKSILNKK